MKLLVTIIIFTFSLIQFPAFCQLTGGWTNHDPNLISDYDLVNITSFLTQRYSARFKEDCFLDEILSYQTQIVAGTNHKLVVQLKNFSSNKKTIVFAIIFEAISNKELILNQLLQIIDSNENIFHEIKDQNIITELKEKVVKVQEYLSNGKIKCNIRKIKWALSAAATGNFYLNYEIEGTNNEISVWEHWFKKSEGNRNAFDSSLFAIKLPLGMFRFENFEMVEECSSIRSYLICGLKNCYNKSFLTDGKCRISGN